MLRVAKAILVKSIHLNVSAFFVHKFKGVNSMHIKELLNESLIDKQVVFDKCLIVSVKLPNGFIIVESSACVNPKDFDIEIGTNICMKRIEDKLWELEGYKLHDKK